MPNSAIQATLQLTPYLSPGGLSKIRRELAGATAFGQGAKQISAFGGSLGRISVKASEFEKSMNAATARVFAFGAAMVVINSAIQSFKALVSVTIEVDKALGEIKSILGGTAQEFSRFKNEIFSVAQNTGQGFSFIAEGAKELARQGLSGTESAKRLNAAAILARVSGLSMAEAVSTVTTAVNGFSNSGLTAQQIVEKLVAVDDRFVGGAKDLAGALQRVGSTAQDAGISIDELNGLVTAVATKTGRSGAEIGNALKTILPRLSRPKTIEDLQALGVEINEAQNGIQKLIALQRALDKNEGNIQKTNQILDVGAGLRQINILSSLIKDLQGENPVSNQASEVSANAINEATTRNIELNELLSAKIQKVATLFTEAGSAAGNLVIKPGLLLFIKALDSLGRKLSFIFSEEKGTEIFQTFFAGIGKFLAGPGILIFVKAFSNILRLVKNFAIEATQSLFAAHGQNRKIAQIEQVLVNLLQEESGVRTIIESKTLSQAEKERAINGILAARTLELERQRAIITGLATSISKGGGSAVGGLIVKRKASGFMQAKALEEIQARALGAKNPRAHLSQGTIDGRRFMMNNREIEIPNFSRGNSAVIPTYPGGFIEKGFNIAQRTDVSFNRLKLEAEANKRASIEERVQTNLLNVREEQRKLILEENRQKINSFNTEKKLEEAKKKQVQAIVKRAELDKFNTPAGRHKNIRKLIDAGVIDPKTISRTSPTYQRKLINAGVLHPRAPFPTFQPKTFSGKFANPNRGRTSNLDTSILTHQGRRQRQLQRAAIKAAESHGFLDRSNKDYSKELNRLTESVKKTKQTFAQSVTAVNKRSFGAFGAGALGVSFAASQAASFAEQAGQKELSSVLQATSLGAIVGGGSGAAIALTATTVYFTGKAVVKSSGLLDVIAGKGDTVFGSEFLGDLVKQFLKNATGGPLGKLSDRLLGTSFERFNTFEFNKDPKFETQAEETRKERRGLAELLQKDFSAFQKTVFKDLLDKVVSAEGDVGKLSNDQIKEFAAQAAFAGEQLEKVANFSGKLATRFEELSISRAIEQSQTLQQLNVPGANARTGAFKTVSELNESKLTALGSLVSAFDFSSKEFRDAILSKAQQEGFIDPGGVLNDVDSQLKSGELTKSLQKAFAGGDIKGLENRLSKIIDVDSDEGKKITQQVAEGLTKARESGSSALIKGNNAIVDIIGQIKEVNQKILSENQKLLHAQVKSPLELARILKEDSKPASLEEVIKKQLEFENKRAKGDFDKNLFNEIVTLRENITSRFPDEIGLGILGGIDKKTGFNQGGGREFFNQAFSLDSFKDFKNLIGSTTPSGRRVSQIIKSFEETGDTFEIGGLLPILQKFKSGSNSPQLTEAIKTAEIAANSISSLTDEKGRKISTLNLRGDEDRQSIIDSQAGLKGEKNELRDAERALRNEVTELSQIFPSLAISLRTMQSTVETVTSSGAGLNQMVANMDAFYNATSETIKRLTKNVSSIGVEVGRLSPGFNFSR